MVSTTSPAAQVNDTEQRKRKQTLERAKAHHLSRQLQLRLQYARLKVDHGWQKQNLNEVENLYFHHSHMRGPKPNSIITTFANPAQAALAGHSHPTPSNLSFRQPLDGSSRAASSNTQNISTPDARILIEQDPTSTTSPSLATELTSMTPEHTSAMSKDWSLDLASSSAAAPPKTPTETSHSPSPFSSQTPTPSSPSGISRTPKSKSRQKTKLKPMSLSAASPLSSRTQQQNSGSNMSTAMTSSTYQSDAAGGLRTHGGGGGPGTSGKAMGFSFPNSTLTYDSFWSSHPSSSASATIASPRGFSGSGMVTGSG